MMLSRIWLIHGARAFSVRPPLAALKVPIHSTRLKLDTVKIVEKTIVAISNKIKNTVPCEFCNGTGLMQCLRCHNGCWECQHTRLMTCRYCGGTGRGSGRNFDLIDTQLKIAMP